MIEWAGLAVLALLPSCQSENGSSLSERFSTTTATLPSRLRNAVAIKVSTIEEHEIRRAPGRMNFEKCPM